MHDRVAFFSLVAVGFTTANDFNVLGLFTLVRLGYLFSSMYNFHISQLILLPSPI